MERDQFEVVFIEYYSRVSEPMKQFAEQVDTWLLLEMPESCIYHKHLMYNCGIVFCHGEIVLICDSDAMVKDSFIQTIIDEFEENNRIVLHLDQFRNSRKDFYPFNYPSFDEVVGEGCINNVDGKTEGIRDTVDPLHSRNYGACMCARRADLIAIGGADEHLDYLGHICGPYEMTFRLVHYGLKEVWHEDEFLYHTWHPGQAGVDNYKGPHDGMHMSSTALEALITKRMWPLVENKVVQFLRKQERVSHEVMEGEVVNQQYVHDWDRATVRKLGRNGPPDKIGNPIHIYRGFKIIPDGKRYHALPLVESYFHKTNHRQSRVALECSSPADLLKCIDHEYPYALRTSELVNSLFWNIVWPLTRIIRYLESRLLIGAKSNRPQDLRNARRDEGSSSTIFEFYQKCKTKWFTSRQRLADMTEYTTYMTHWTNSLVTNLYFMQGLSAAHGERHVLLTTSSYLQFYLKVLMTLKMIPRIRIVRLKGEDEIKTCFEALTEKNEAGGFILTRDIYIGHYGLVKSYPRFAGALVL